MTTKPLPGPFEAFTRRQGKGCPVIWRSSIQPCTTRHNSVREPAAAPPINTNDASSQTRYLRKFFTLGPSGGNIRLLKGDVADSRAPPSRRSFGREDGPWTSEPPKSSWKTRRAAAQRGSTAHTAGLCAARKGSSFKHSCSNCFARNRETAFCFDTGQGSEPGREQGPPHRSREMRLCRLSDYAIGLYFEAQPIRKACNFSASRSRLRGPARRDRLAFRNGADVRTRAGSERRLAADQLPPGDDGAKGASARTHMLSYGPYRIGRRSQVLMSKKMSA